MAIPIQRVLTSEYLRVERFSKNIMEISISAKYTQTNVIFNNKIIVSLNMQTKTYENRLACVKLREFGYCFEL